MIKLPLSLALFLAFLFASFSPVMAAQPTPQTRDMFRMKSSSSFARKSMKVKKTLRVFVYSERARRLSRYSETPRWLNLAAA